MNEGLITSEEKSRLAALFTSGLSNLDILWDENRRALADAWEKAQRTSEALKDMKSVDALHDLSPAPRAYAKLFAYLGLTEGLGVTLIDITSLLLIANRNDMHFRKGGGMMHVSRFKDLHRLNLLYKLEFLDAHKLGFVSKIVNRDLRNMIARLSFTITENGTIRDSGNREINIDTEIGVFWDRVSALISAFDEKGLLKFIQQSGVKP
jgi:hypothetical protein